jgi:hypothetical protein
MTKKLTNNVGAPVADNQNLMTAGPRFCTQRDEHRSTIFIAARCISSDNERRKPYE